MAFLIKAITIFFTSTVKFFYAPGASLALGLGFWETILITLSGGVTGVLVFYFAGQWVIQKSDEFRKRGRELISSDASQKKVFTKRSRFYVSLRRNISVVGLALLTPVLISIPIGTILAVRFFSHNRYTLYYLLGSVVLWSFLLTIFFHYLKEMIFG